MYPTLEISELIIALRQEVAALVEEKAAFPQGVNAHVQYGPRLPAAAVYLNIQQLIPEDRVARCWPICSPPPACARPAW